MTDQDDETENQTPRPKTVRDGDIKASIWRNEGESGVFHSTTLARTYEDKDGRLRDTNSFIGTDLLRVAEIARQAYTQSRAMDREARKSAFKEKRGIAPTSARTQSRSR